MLKKTFRYFNESLLRKVFFVLLCLSAIATVFALIFQNRIIAIVLVSLYLVTILISTVDTWRERREFNAFVDEERRESLGELLEKREKGEKVNLSDTFSKSEQDYIKRKRRDYKLWIFTKLMLCAICIFILVMQLQM